MKILSWYFNQSNAYTTAQLRASKVNLMTSSLVLVSPSFFFVYQCSLTASFVPVRQLQVTKNMSQHQLRITIPDGMQEIVLPESTMENLRRACAETAAITATMAQLNDTLEKYAT
jgi:hypothetical protein